MPVVVQQEWSVSPDRRHRSASRACGSPDCPDAAQAARQGKAARTLACWLAADRDGLDSIDAVTRRSQVAPPAIAT